MTRKVTKELSEITLRKALNAMMVKSAEDSLKAGKRIQAAEYCRLVLILYPRQVKARSLLERLKRENAQIEARGPRVRKFRFRKIKK